MENRPEAAAAAVDEARLWRRLMEMAAIGGRADGGVNRQALSPEDAAARQLLLGWAGEIGLAAATDPIGNLFLRRPGTNPAAAPVLTGSHLDSQPTGGKFDGAFGVLAGFEALEAIDRAGINTRHPIEVVAWTNEEGSRFQPGVMGSAVFAGDLPLDRALAVTDSGGTSVAAALDETLSATPGLARRDAGFPLAAYVEAHIEQGPRLEAAGNTIGVVTGIQGLYWYTVEVFGAEAHAGTTPLAERKDALRAAIAMLAALQDAMADPSDTVRFTVGRLEVAPGSPNTVPAHVLFTIDFRHPDPAVIERLTARIAPICEANAMGCRVAVRQTAGTPPVTFDSDVIDTVRAQATRLGLGHMDLPSGAGHDAMHMAGLCPTGMIFVPCARGVSHNPAESATPADLAAGARVLAATLVVLAGR